MPTRLARVRHAKGFTADCGDGDFHEKDRGTEQQSETLDHSEGPGAQGCGGRVEVLRDSCMQCLHLFFGGPHLLTHLDCARVVLKSVLAPSTRLLASRLQRAFHKRSTDIHKYLLFSLT